MVGRIGALVLGLLLVGCSIGTPRPPVPPPNVPPSPTPTATWVPTGTPARLVARPSVVATPTTPGTPEGATPCTQERVEWVIAGFVAAFNRGDRAELIGRLAQPDAYGFDPFRWFRVAEGGGAGTVLTTRDAAADFLVARQVAGEQLELVGVAAPTTHVSTVDGVDVSLVSRHPAQGERSFRAKALIECGRARVHAWTMTDAPAPAGVQVVVDEGPLPQGCWSGEEVATLILRFLDAFNRGDQAALVNFFPAEGTRINNMNPEQLQWYSVVEGNPPTRTFVANDRETLLRYFAERHGHGEQLSLQSLEIGEGRQNDVNFGFEIARNADDLGATERGTPNTSTGRLVAGGHGAVNCGKGTIYLWAMASR